MPLIETDTSLFEVDYEQFWGHNIELPKPGSRTGGRTFEIAGWVLGRVSPVVAVELLHGGGVIQRVPVNVRRPDLEKCFPQVKEATHGGFRAKVTMPSLEEFEVRVGVVLRDQSHSVLGLVRAHRIWREADEDTGTSLVSVVVPCYNQAHCLGDAIESVLEQSYPHFEVVVVDDGSTDNSQEVVDRYPSVRYVWQQNQGLSATRNTGLRHTQGSYLVFLDANDRLLPGALQAGLDCLHAHPECALVAGRCIRIGLDGVHIGSSPQTLREKDHYRALLRQNYIWLPASVMYRRSVFESVKGFDTFLRASEDYDLYLRVAMDFPIHYHDKVVAEHRLQHGSNMLRDSGLMLSSTIAVLRSQWDYVRRQGRAYKAAYRTGLKHWRRSFGGQLVEEVRNHIRAHNWTLALRDIGILWRVYPRGLVSLMLAYPMPRAEQQTVSRLGGRESPSDSERRIQELMEERVRAVATLEATIQSLQEQLKDQRITISELRRALETVPADKPAAQRDVDELS